MVNDNTIKFWLTQIRRNPNKKHFRVRKFASEINSIVGSYRLTAIKMRGTNAATVCNRMANMLEKELLFALNVR